MDVKTAGGVGERDGVRSAEADGAREVDVAGRAAAALLGTVGAFQALLAAVGLDHEVLGVLAAGPQGRDGQASGDGRGDGQAGGVVGGALAGRGWVVALTQAPVTAALIVMAVLMTRPTAADA